MGFDEHVFLAVQLELDHTGRVIRLVARDMKAEVLARDEPLLLRIVDHLLPALIDPSQPEPDQRVGIRS